MRSLKVSWLLTLCLLSIAPATESAAWLLSEELLDHAGLTRVWQATLPVREGESLESLVLAEDDLCIHSSQNYGWSLNRNDGRVICGVSIASPGFPLLGWSIYEDRVITVVDNQLVEFDKSTGLRKRVSELELTIVAPPVRNSRFFYLSGADRRLHVLRAADLVPVFEVSARSKAEITSVLADEDMVVFGTSAGNLVALMADAPRKLWQFDATEAMAGPVIRDGSSYYFANKDTHVYRVDTADAGQATLGWKYQTEAILDRPPHVTAAVVYQYALSRGLTAIDKQSGKALWFLPEGMDLLTEARDKAYVLTKFNSLVVMDNRSGKRLREVNFAAVSNHAANTTDAMIYIADDRGHIVCLRPAS